MKKLVIVIVNGKLDAVSQHDTDEQAMAKAVEEAADKCDTLYSNKEVKQMLSEPSRQVISSSGRFRLYIR